MSRQDIDFDHLRINKPPARETDASISVHDGVLIVVDRAYGPTGEQLVGISEVEFDGFPALTLLLRAAGREGLVHLSPLHGDPRKSGMTDLPAGTTCELLCPISRRPLDRIGKVIKGADAEYYAVYLTPKLSAGSAIYISNVWGDYHSRVVDQGELISAWAAGEEAEAEPS